MLNHALFVIALFMGNVVQVITGFGGVVLAIPFCALLVGLGRSIAVVNLISLLTGGVMAWRLRSRLDYPLLKQTFLIMLPGLFLGIFAVHYLREYEQIQKVILGVFVLTVGAANLLKSWLRVPWRAGPSALAVLLFIGGFFHGMFVCGGALMVLYIANRAPEKDAFRANIAAMWPPLNTIVLVFHIAGGALDAEALALTAACLPPVWISLVVGAALAGRMSQAFFAALTNILLMISGLTLIIA